jgi:hypothetical protein
MEKPMASEERDRKFDQALARHLRSAGVANEAARVPPDSSSAFSACPDAETLAAYHERSLLPEELNSCKEHIVGCKNCQMILAHLEETDAIPLQALDEEKVFVSAELGSVAASASRTPAPMSALAGRADEKSGAIASGAGKGHRARPLQGTRWSWLVPAGAIAAGLLVWIAVHENQPLQRMNPEEPKIAKNEPAVTAPIPADRTLAPPASSGAVGKIQSLPSRVASTNGRSESHGFEAHQKQVPTMAPEEAPFSAYSDKESGLRKDAEREKSDDLRQAEPQRDLDAKPVNGAMQERVELKAQAAAQARAESLRQEQTQQKLAVTQDQNQINNSNMQKVPGPAPLGQATEAKKMKPAQPAPAPSAPAAGAAGGIAGNYQSSGAFELAKESDARLIVAPGFAAMWRTGPGGLLEFSSDKGASWSRQPSGVHVDLLTGSAVSDKTCWIAGRAGTVLLTTDGGGYWKTLTSPLNDDLGLIRATDALHAKVWNIQRNKAYETKDGGVTWQAAATP